MITIKVSLHSKNRGHGFWKLNTSLLEDTEYVQGRSQKKFMTEAMSMVKTMTEAMSMVKFSS